MGRPNFLDYLREGNWRPIVSLSLGALICGFFWEMWNYYSWPKWIYHTPGAQFLEVFEMPLLGYGGNVPVPLAVVVLRKLLWGGAPNGEKSWSSLFGNTIRYAGVSPPSKHEDALTVT